MNETVQRNVWAFTINKDKSLSNKHLLIAFPDFGFDGMRADVDGNLYITRHGKGAVVGGIPARESSQRGRRPGGSPTNTASAVRMAEPPTSQK